MARASRKKKPSVGRKKTQADLLIELAESLYDTLVDTTGRVFAVPKTPPRIAVPLQGRGALGKRLTLAYYERYGGTPTPTAVANALAVVEARAMDKPRTTVALRCARTASGLALDLGDAAGRTVVIHSGRWRVVDAPPEGVVFRRTRLTTAMPTPRRSGKLDGLRGLVNVSDEGWDLIRAWLVMAWLPDIPVPILSITGQQGAGKSVLARTLVAVTDPSSAPLRAAPRNLEEWVTIASGSRVLGIDNISSISQDFSDVLCRAVTGDSQAKRQLYEDDELVVQSFHRALILTSIDPGSVRGDLGDRLLPVELEPIGKRRRREQELNDALAKRLPSILGGLLDLTAAVLANPVELSDKPRMADAAVVMASVDEAVGARSLPAYRRSQEHVVETVLESDPVAAAVLDFMKQPGRGEWVGEPAEFYRLVSGLRDHESRNWPANAKSMSQRLRRLEPALREVHGLIVTRPTRGKRRALRLRWSELRPPELKRRGRRPRVKGSAQ